MKRRILIAALWGSPLFAVLFGFHLAAGQTSTLVLGGSYTENVNLKAMLAVPSCSVSAGCDSTLKICNLTNGLPDPTRCISLSETIPVAVTPLGVVIEQSAAGKISDFDVATLHVQVPAAEVFSTK